MFASKQFNMKTAQVRYEENGEEDLSSLNTFIESKSKHSACIELLFFYQMFR